MTWRLYIVPVIGTGLDHTDPRRAKYFSGSGIVSISIDYGLEPVMLVAADVDTTQHDAIVINTDVLAMPEDIDQNMSPGAVSTAQTFLESLNIPAGWVTTSLTYRQVLRVVAGLFQFAQRWQALGGGRIFGTGVTFSTRFNQLPQATRDRLIETATSLGYDTSTLSGASTIRTMLKTMADAWGSRPFIIGGITL